jgi:hypothetical protein
MVPSEEMYPGSQGLYEWYQGKLAADFMREDGSAGYTNKGLLTEFIGIKCEQNSDGTIVLDMSKYNEELVKRHGFAQAHRASAPQASQARFSPRSTAQRLVTRILLTRPHTDPR